MTHRYRVPAAIGVVASVLLAIHPLLEYAQRTLAPELVAGTPALALIGLHVPLICLAATLAARFRIVDRVAAGAALITVGVFEGSPAAWFLALSFGLSWVWFSAAGSLLAIAAGIGFTRMRAS